MNNYELEIFDYKIPVKAENAYRAMKKAKKKYFKLVKIGGLEKYKNILT